MPTNYERIKTLARERGIAITHICRELGHDHSYINTMRRDGRTLSDDTICKIAKMLGTSPDYLRGETDDPDPNYILRQSESLEERLLHLVMQKLPEMTEGQINSLSRLFSLDKADFDCMIAPLEIWSK